MRKGVPEEKIEVIYNWGYSDDIVEIPWEKNEFVKKYHLSEKKFYAVYAGNIGKMQNVELIVNAAKRLMDKKDIHFLIIGDGAKRADIEEMARAMKNITILPFQPHELALHIYSVANINLIPLVENGIKTALPSKTGVVLSCGKPALFCFGEETRFEDIFNGFPNVFVCSGSDSVEVANMILRIKNMVIDVNYGAFEKYFKSSNAIEYNNIIKSVKI